MSVNYSIQYEMAEGIGAIMYGPEAILRTMRRWKPPHGWPYPLRIVEITHSPEAYSRKDLYRWDKKENRWAWIEEL